MLSSLELWGYRIESIQGARFSLQLFENGCLIYKTFLPGVRNGIAKHVECFSVLGTPFWEDCLLLGKKKRAWFYWSPALPEGIAVREDLIYRGVVAGSSFLHNSGLDYEKRDVRKWKEDDFKAAFGDCADQLVSLFFKAYPTLKRITDTEYSDYLDPFLEEDIHFLAPRLNDDRTGGLDKLKRPCLNSFSISYHTDPSKQECLLQERIEDFVHRNFLKKLTTAHSQEEFDQRYDAIFDRCSAIYRGHFLDGESVERYLCQIGLAYVLKGEIKSCSVLRWLHPDYRDVLSWHGEDFFYHPDYFLPLKYYRWKSEDKKQVPMFFFLILEQENEAPMEPHRS